MNNPKITVVIPTYNSWKTLIPCIKSILNQTLKPNEIIIVDNASTDETIDKVKEIESSTNFFRLVKNDINLGVTGGRNRGIKEAGKNYEYLLFFDHDMVADKKMLEELVKVAESNSKIGITTAKIYYWEKKDFIWSAGTEINLWTGMNRFRNGKDTGQFDEDSEVQIAPAVIFIKKSVIEKIGGFDDVFFAVYEDTEYCYRAKKYGLLTYYAPKAISYHKIPFDEKDSMKRLLERLYWIGRNRTIFMKKYAKNYFVYLMNLPIFIVYYLYISVRYKNIVAFKSFIKGLVSGLCYRI